MLLEHIFNGLSIGSTYALIALGYTMVYGTLGFINFAHGDLYMIGAYIGFFILSISQLPIVLVLILSMIATGIIGVIVERIAYRPLRKQPRLLVMISSIGVSIVLQAIVLLLNGPQTERYKIEEYTIVNILGVNVSTLNIIILIIAILLMLTLNFIVQKTRIGTAMRCVSESVETTSLMGISTDFIISITFFTGSSLGCAAGILTGVVYHAITPFMGSLAGTKAFVAAIVGGIGSIPGAMLGGMLLGFIEYFTVVLLSSSWRDAVAFLLLIVFLLLRPTGILGKKTRERV